MSDSLRDLHAELAKELLKRMRSGDATAQEMMVAARFLKDNGIDSLPQASQPLQDLVKIVGERLFQGDDAPAN